MSGSSAGSQGDAVERGVGLAVAAIEAAVAGPVQRASTGLAPQRAAKDIAQMMVRMATAVMAALRGLTRRCLFVPGREDDYCLKRTTVPPAVAS